jgi:hypothetical protein
MDLGDWQEFTRLRAENHAWHRCVQDILASTRKTALSSDALAASIDRSVATLDERLRALGRRGVRGR